RPPRPRHRRHDLRRSGRTGRGRMGFLPRPGGRMDRPLRPAHRPHLWAADPRPAEARALRPRSTPRPRRPPPAQTARGRGEVGGDGSGGARPGMAAGGVTRVAVCIPTVGAARETELEQTVRAYEAQRTDTMFVGVYVVTGKTWGEGCNELARIALQHEWD